jgi:hypothetical protein
MSPLKKHQFPVSMCSALRKLGLDLQIEVGTLKLLSDFVITQTGVPITAEQAKVLVNGYP